MMSKCSTLIAASLYLSFTILQPAHASSSFALDTFKVTRGETTLFTDSFSENVTAHYAPNYSNGAAAGYSVIGAADIDAGKKVPFLVGGSSSAQTLVPLTTLLNTNASGLAIDAARGLKSGFPFSVFGLFNLSSSGSFNEGYGVRLTDQTNSSKGTDTFTLGVRREADDHLYVTFRQINLSAGTSTTLEKFALETTHAQILLMLDRPDALSNAIHGSYAYVDGGVAGSSNAFVTTPTIFNSVNFTRAGFDAVTPVPLPAAVWLLGSGLLGLVTASRKRSAAGQA